MLAVSGPREKYLSWGGMQGTEALCRPGSSRALGAVMSAGGEIKIGKQHGTGRAFRRSTAATHHVQQRHADMTYNIFMLVPRVRHSQHHCYPRNPSILSKIRYVNYLLT